MRKRRDERAALDSTVIVARSSSKVKDHVLLLLSQSNSL
jgi:hypothetical protein